MHTRNVINVSVIGIFCLIALARPVEAARQSSPSQGDPSEELADIQRAIKNGNSAELAKYSSTYVEVSMLGATTLHSRAQTAYILRAFFRDYPADRFAFQRKMRLGRDWFVTGKYWHRGDNRPYQVEILLRWNGRSYEIKNIRIDQGIR